MSNKAKPLAVCGVALQFGFLIGLFGTIISMLQAFHTLGTAAGPAKQEALAWNVSMVLYTTVAGMLVSLVGGVLLLIALWGAKYRAPWFRVAMWIVSILWLFSVPIGTVLGIIVMVYLSNHKDEFTEPKNPAYPSPAAGSGR